MKIVTVSTFWNCEKYVKECIQSLKNQYYTNFISYFIDDMSTDNSYEEAKKAIGEDSRFILIKNENKKFKTKNFIDVIRNNPKISWDDVIVEIDGDDRLSDSHVLGLINKVFTNNDVWICGTRWSDNKGRLGNYGKPKPEKARKTSWNFSHMRSYRAFLFRSIDDKHLKFNGEYFKAGCDLGIGIPMLEMSGEEHFRYINEPLYIYNWHDKQSYSDNNSFGDKTLQGRTAKYIYSLPSYEKLVLVDETSLPEEKVVVKSSKQILDEIFDDSKHIKLTPTIRKPIPINYDKINRVGVFNPKEHVKQPITQKPKEAPIVFKEDSISKLKREMFQIKPKRKGDAPNVFGNSQRRKGGFSI